MSYQNEIIKVNRNLSLLAPGFRTKVEEAIAECHKQGYQVEVFEGWRSPERQLHLYQQGRTSPGKKVTNAYPWFSFHQYGVAVDIAYKISGKWSWEGDFDKPGAIFTEMGFDKPPVFERAHFQISNGLHIAEVRRICLSSSLQAVWIAMNLH